MTHFVGKANFRLREMQKFDTSKESVVRMIKKFGIVKKDQARFREVCRMINQKKWYQVAAFSIVLPSTVVAYLFRPNMTATTILYYERRKPGDKIVWQPVRTGVYYDYRICNER